MAVIVFLDVAPTAVPANIHLSGVVPPFRTAFRTEASVCDRSSKLEPMSTPEASRAEAVTQEAGALKAGTRVSTGPPPHTYSRLPSPNRRHRMNSFPSYTPPQYTRSSPQASSARSSSGSASTTASAEMSLQRQFVREHYQAELGGMYGDEPISLQPVNAMYSHPGTSSNLADTTNPAVGEQYPTFAVYGQEGGGPYQPLYEPDAPLAPTTPIKVGHQRLPHDPYGSHHQHQQHQQQYPPSAPSSRLPLAVNAAPNTANTLNQSHASRYDPLYAKSNNNRNVPHTAAVAPNPAAAFVPDSGSAPYSHWPAHAAAPQGGYSPHRQQMPLGYAQGGLFPQGHGQQYGQGHTQWQGQGGSSSSSASPQGFMAHSLSPVSPGPSAGFSSSGLVPVPQREYEKRGGIFKGERQKSIRFREVNASFDGIQLSRLENLADPNDEVTRGMKANQMLRINWPGYDNWDSQLPGKDDRKPKRFWSRSALARKIATKMAEFIRIHENQRCSEQHLRWRVGGSDGLKLEDLYLVKLEHISQGSWRPVLYVRAGRVPPA